MNDLSHGAGYLILGTPILSGFPGYRGTYRSTPSYVEGLPEDSAANRAFRWYCSEGGELGIVKDLHQAQGLVTLYGRLETRQDFEVIRLLGDEQDRSSGEGFLGFDLSMRAHQSLLAWGLRLLDQVEKGPSTSLLRGARPLVRLIEEVFRPELNEHLLFPQRKRAAFCLDAMKALQGFVPGLWEGDEYLPDFRVLGLSLERPRSGS